MTFSAGDLKEMIRSVLREERDQQPQESQGHTIEHFLAVLNCPECSKKVAEMIMKGELVGCDKCGAIVPKTAPFCRNCGSTKAHSLRR